MGALGGFSRMLNITNLQNGRLTTVMSFCSNESNEVQDIDDVCRNIDTEPTGYNNDKAFFSPEQYTHDYDIMSDVASFSNKKHD
jgi:uncharacterized membrane protein